MTPSAIWERPGLGGAWLRAAGQFGLVLLAVLALQWLDGAYTNELGKHADEAAHYVTGRMAADYLTTAPGRNPRDFAELYYAKYPKVAIGHWPPLFYGLMAGWFLAFGDGYRALFVLMALITALLGFTIGRLVRRDYGTPVGLAASLLAVAFPFVHGTTACLMADPLMALLSLWTILAFGRYIEAPDVGRATAFGCLASAAILTKGNGAALGLMVPIAVCLGRRWDLPRRRSFWLSGLVVAVLCGPWYYATRNLARGALYHLDPSVGSVAQALTIPLIETVRGFGVAASAVALIGAVAALLRHRVPRGETVALIAFFPAFVLLHAFTLPGELEHRFLIMLVPAVVVFVAYAVDLAIGRLGRGWAREHARPAATLLFSGWAIYLVATFPFPEKSCQGYGPLVRSLLATPGLRTGPILICSDSRGEGMFVAEALRQDTGRSSLVLRGTKIFASIPWNREEYVPFVQDPEDIRRILGELAVNVVVLDDSVPGRALEWHQRLLSRYLESGSSDYRELAAHKVVRDGRSLPRGLRVFVANAGPARSPTDFEIDMRHSLGRPIKIMVHEGRMEARFSD